MGLHPSALHLVTTVAPATLQNSRNRAWQMLAYLAWVRHAEKIAGDWNKTPGVSREKTIEGRHWKSNVLDREILLVILI